MTEQIQVTVDFVGGPKDGTSRTFPYPILRNPIDSDEASAWFFYEGTAGAVGTTISSASPMQRQIQKEKGWDAVRESGSKPCTYQVITRDELEDGSVRLVVKHLPDFKP